jgi:hypothetical protein
MTLRVWAKELDSVSFGKGGPRFLTGLRGIPSHAREIVDHLATFAHEQSIVVAPTSQTDLKKSAILTAMGRPDAAARSASTLLSGLAPTRPLVCPACAAPVTPDDRFCGSCGAAQVST